MARLLGRVACWGNGDFGRLGHDSQRSEAFPRLVATLSEQDITRVACGAAHTLALAADGTVHTFGLNIFGQLGHSQESQYVQSPKEVLLPEEVTEVAAGSNHTLFLAASGSVWAAGSNQHGQLGLGTSHASCSLPRRLQALVGTKIVAIAAGAQHSLAVSVEGELFTWGSGHRGCLGHGRSLLQGYINEGLPRLVSKLRRSGVQSAAGGLMTSGCVDGNGRAYLWGPNMRDQVTSPAGEAGYPQIVPGLQAVVQLALGGSHALALMQSGSLAVMGTNEHGCLGVGSDGDTASATGISLLPDLSFQQVAAGWRHSAGVDRFGHLFTWGWGGSVGSDSALFPSHNSAGGQLGHGQEFDCWQPTCVEQLIGDECSKQLPAWRAHQVACGFNHTAALVQVL